ncbi:MAG: copper transporter [Acetobacteraceae bacterium]|nr:copper transporter [Acetobacteraceae bacterium]
MSDLRLHIASLAAVFLALGLGILVGTAFVGTPVVERQAQAMVRQQKALVQRLDDLSGTLRREADVADKNEAAMRALLPGLVAGKLDGRRVLVVRAGDYAEAAERAAEALGLAGAIVARADLPEEAWQARFAAGGVAGANRERIAAEARALAPLLLGEGNGTDGLKPYREEGRLVGDNLPAGARLVVLVGGKRLSPGEEPPTGRGEGPLMQELGAALIRAWRQASPEVTVVGVEPLEAEVSFITAYQNEGVATVDNIDRAAGQIALPSALRGERAAYGMKPTAELVLPLSLQEPARREPDRPGAAGRLPAGAL